MSIPLLVTCKDLTSSFISNNRQIFHVQSAVYFVLVGDMVKQIEPVYVHSITIPLYILCKYKKYRGLIAEHNVIDIIQHAV